MSQYLVYTYDNNLFLGSTVGITYKVSLKHKLAGTVDYYYQVDFDPLLWVSYLKDEILLQSHVKMCYISLLEIDPVEGKTGQCWWGVGKLILRND